MELGIGSVEPRVLQLLDLFCTGTSSHPLRLSPSLPIPRACL